MAQYINKAALLAEIDRQEIGYNVDGKHSVEYNTTRKILDIIDSIEVKGVELEEEINHWQGFEAFPEDVNITPLPKAMEIVERTERHFFELGLKAAQNTN